MLDSLSDPAHPVIEVWIIQHDQFVPRNGIVPSNQRRNVHGQRKSIDTPGIIRRAVSVTAISMPYRPEAIVESLLNPEYHHQQHRNYSPKQEPTQEVTYCT